MRAFAFAFLFAVCSLTGCAFLQKNANTVDAVLDNVALECVFTSELVDSTELAKVCGVAQALVPVIKQLISQREAAKKAGVHWTVASNVVIDAGGE